jgi:hypothetical protein
MTKHPQDPIILLEDGTKCIVCLGQIERLINSIDHGQKFGGHKV